MGLVAWTPQQWGAVEPPPPPDATVLRGAATLQALAQRPPPVQGEGEGATPQCPRGPPDGGRSQLQCWRSGGS